MKIAIVTWEDASTDPDTWITRQDAPDVKPCIHQQVGWVLEVTPKHVVLTCTVSDALLGGRTRIPRAMVRSISYLKLPARKR